MRRPASFSWTREHREVVWALARLVVGLGVLVGIVSLIGWRYRDELAHFATWFVARFGLGGMFGGVVLADGLMVPVPPQVYLLTGIAAGYPTPIAFGIVALGSETGGIVAFSIGRLLGRTQLIAKRLAKPRELLERLIAKRGALGLVVASLFPIAYSALCMTTGAMRQPYRSYVVLGAMRLPKLFLSYVVIRYAWHG